MGCRLRLRETERTVGSAPFHAKQQVARPWPRLAWCVPFKSDRWPDSFLATTVLGSESGRRYLPSGVAEYRFAWKALRALPPLA